MPDGYAWGDASHPESPHVHMFCLKKRLRMPFLNPPAADTLLRSRANTGYERLMRSYPYAFIRPQQ